VAEIKNTSKPCHTIVFRRGRMELERVDSESWPVLWRSNNVMQFSHKSVFKTRKHRCTTNNYDVFCQCTSSIQWTLTSDRHRYRIYTSVKDYFTTSTSTINEWPESKANELSVLEYVHFVVDFVLLQHLNTQCGE